MSDMYKARVNDDFDFRIQEKDLSELDIIQTSYRAYHLVEKNQSIKAQIVNTDLPNKTYTVLLGSNLYRVKLDDTVDQLIEEMGLSVGVGKKVNALNAPMPGLVLEINVKDGDAVKEGDQLLILSAMKMENSFLSPRDGVIKAVHVSTEQAIDKGHLLIEFED